MHSLWWWLEHTVCKRYPTSGCAASGRRNDEPIGVIAGLDPAIPINFARSHPAKRDGRVKPGHDGSEKIDSANF
jgi:hypothetical protein